MGQEVRYCFSGLVEIRRMSVPEAADRAQEHGSGRGRGSICNVLDKNEVLKLNEVLNITEVLRQDSRRAFQELCNNVQ